MSVLMLKAEFEYKPSDEDIRKALKKKLKEIIEKEPLDNPKKLNEYFQEVEDYQIFWRDQKTIPAEDAERMHRISWAQINIFKVFKRTYTQKTLDLQSKAVKLRNKQIEYVKTNSAVNKEISFITCTFCKSKINKQKYLEAFNPSHNHPCQCPICNNMAETQAFMTRYNNMQKRLDEINQELNEEYKKLSKRYLYTAFAYIKE